MSFKAIIFDLDGVLIDSEPIIIDQTLELLEFCGLKLSKAKYVKEYYKNTVGKTTEESFYEFKKMHGFNCTYSDLLKKKNELKEKYFNKFSPMAYAKEIVKYAKSKDLKLAIVTSSIKEKILFLQNKYPGVFDADVIVTSEDVLMGKPNPECFLLASRKLKIKPSEILVVEDSINGMLAGQRGNFKVAILKNPFLKKSDYIPEPNYWLKDLRDIKKLL